MRKIEYNSYIEKLRKKSLNLYTKWVAGIDKPLRSSRPRDPEEEYILFLLDRHRWDQALASGRIEKIGPRRYRWNG
ncbi:hypothetical protein [Calderihabitans maritimus]|uniref:Uncharacterized protein n=1 Tax=Calderihabitans maritimus TaxID=1246530 RepID=A0A1Z5HVW4_9FIRM|nr:hypothetical protein [Calderihabitans maritimus]GAW93410.1 hypothetical protein KKC1_25440 [Calderihabitans maritimus]